MSSDSEEENMNLKSSSSQAKFKLFNQNEEFNRKAKRSVLYYKNTDLLDHYLYDQTYKRKGTKKKLNLDTR